MPDCSFAWHVLALGCVPPAPPRPTQVAVPWFMLRRRGHEVLFATQSGEPAQCDRLSIPGVHWLSAPTPPLVLDMHHGGLVPHLGHSHFSRPPPSTHPLTFTRSHARAHTHTRPYLRPRLATTRSSQGFFSPLLPLLSPSPRTLLAHVFVNRTAEGRCVPKTSVMERRQPRVL